MTYYLNSSNIEFDCRLNGSKRTYHLLQSSMRITSLTDNRSYRTSETNQVNNERRAATADDKQVISLSVMLASSQVPVVKIRSPGQMYMSPITVVLMSIVTRMIILTDI